jgi:hypothetical protein
MQYIVAVLFAAVFARFFRWLLTKRRKRQPGLAAPHLISFGATVLLFPLLSAEGPFANGTADVLHALALYIPAQLVCFIYDWYQARRLSS